MATGKLQDAIVNRSHARRRYDFILGCAKYQIERTLREGTGALQGRCNG